MVRIARLGILIGVGAALCSQGCGGGSGGNATGRSPNAKTSQSVKRSLTEGQLALMQSGIQTGSQAMAFNGPSVIGGFPGFPFIGAFVLRFCNSSPMGAPIPPVGFAITGGSAGGTGSAPGSKSGSASGSGSGSATGGSTVSGGGTGAGGGGVAFGPDDGGFYYDPYLGLWVQTKQSASEWDSLLYVDQAKTTPAGSFKNTFPTGWGTFPVEYTSTYEIDAGSFAGAKGQYDVLAQTQFAGHMKYSNSWPTFGTNNGQSDWNSAGWKWTYASQRTDGTWDTSTGAFAADGSGDATFQDSQSCNWTAHFNADGSGNGTIQGPDVELPAVVTWDSSGHYKIVYADGTVEEFNRWVMMGGSGIGGPMPPEPAPVPPETGPQPLGALRRQ